MQLPVAGDILGAQYELGAQLGEGAFAVVFRARDLKIDREVAVKVLKPRDGGYTDAVRGRFTREIRAMGALHDPHTLRVFNSGETTDGVLWFACELLGGVDLAEWIDEHGAFDETTAVHILRQLLGSVREAHAAGLIHRDIKPGNIRIFTHLEDPFFVKLMDFGIARPTGPDVTRLTNTGNVVGTPRFMAPEQLAGEVTFASDIYALGVVMLDMLAGTRVSVNLLQASRPLDLPTSPHVADIVNRMVEPSIDRRLPSAEAVLKMLERPPRPAHVRSRSSASDSSEIAPERSRSRSRLFLALGVAAAVVALGVVGILARANPEPVAPPARRANPLGAAPGAELRTPGVAADAGATVDLSLARRSGCGAAVRRGDSIGRDTVGTRLIEWHLYVPDSYEESTPAPVVFFFYDGVTATSAAMEHTNIRRLADELDALLIAPLRDTSGIDWTAHTALDFAAILDHVEETHCVDRGRVFALGHEVGGHPAVALSCEPWVRAIATTAYRQSTLTPPCAPWEPRPLIMFAPRDYPGLPIEGGTQCGITEHLSLAQHEQVWFDRNRCSARGAARNLEHGTCETWSCQAPTTSCVVDGGLGWRGAPRRSFDVLGCDGAPTKFDYVAAIAEEFRTYH